MVSGSSGRTNTDVVSLWTPSAGPSGLILVARPKPLLVVVGGHIVEVPSSLEETTEQRLMRRFRQVTLGGLVIVSNSRQKEPTRIVGHPDLASGASVQRGNTLYVSVAEGVYRESRGENVEIHLYPTEEDNEALSDLRARARHRWENDRLPDGWTRPLPPPETPHIAPKDRSIGEMPDSLRALAEQIRAKAEGRSFEE